MPSTLSELYYSKTKRKCFYNIMPVENIPSVIQYGILSYENAKVYNHTSVAMQDVQNRRDQVHIQNGLALHQYANLYMDYHNPMLYRRQDESNHICILAVDISVLDIEGCIMTDRNAAARLAKFYSPDDGIQNIPFEIVFEKDWNKDDYYEKTRHKTIKCAEVLIPRAVPYNYIVGAYVVDQTVQQELVRQGFSKNIVVNPSVFYQ